MMSDFKKGYREGVRAERKRAILVALSAVNRKGAPSTEGHSLAHQIGRAGDMIPTPNTEDVEIWSVFGERRRVRELPTFLESSQSPFTSAGLLYVKRLEERFYKVQSDHDRALCLAHCEDAGTISIFGDERQRIAELEEIIAQLSTQLKGR